MLDSALGWIGEVIHWFGQWIPRWEIVETTHGWVKWIKGSRIESGGAGVVWYWPATTKLGIHPTARQTMNLTTQLLETSDDKAFVIGGVVTYEIDDLEKVLAHTFDPDHTIHDIAQTAIADACSGKTWADLREGINSGKFYTEMRQGLARDLKTFGVRVIKARVSDFAPCRVYRISGIGGQ